MKPLSLSNSQPATNRLTKLFTRKGIARAVSALTVLALPVALAGAVWAAPQATGASESNEQRGHGQGDHGQGKGSHPPRSIDLNELETRSLERFSELDSNNNGLIDTQEYAASASADGKRHKRGHKSRHKGGHRQMGEADQAQHAEQKAALKAKLFTRLDTDGNGVLSDAEFAEARKTRQALREQLHLQHRFEKLDENGDAQLSLVEFQQRLAKMRALDSNNDGTLSRDELRSAKAAHRSGKRALQQDAERPSTQG